MLPRGPRAHRPGAYSSRMQEREERDRPAVPRKTFRVICQSCNGQGVRLVLRMADDDVYPPFQQLTCPVCDGEGRVELVFEFPHGRRGRAGG